MYPNANHTEEKKGWLEELGLLVPVAALIGAAGLFGLHLLHAPNKETQLISNRIQQLGASGTRVWTFHSLTIPRKIKKELDVYFDPSTSIRTEVGRFIPIFGPDGKAWISQGQIEELLKDQNTLVGAKTQNGVIALNDPSLRQSTQRRADIVKNLFELAHDAQNTSFGLVVRESAINSANGPGNSLAELAHKPGAERVVSWGGSSWGGS